jgi:hypothetical protein
MMVVLGAVILLSLLGFVGLRLVSSDRELAGSEVELKAQQMSALSGFDLAIARMEKDPATTVALLNSFRGDPRYQWLLLTGEGVKLSKDAPEFTKLGDGNQGCRVRIVGASPANDPVVYLVLESQGKGRGEDIRRMTATYRIQGVTSTAGRLTNGPAAALFSAQGFGASGTNMKLDIDGGIYSGDEPGVINLQGRSGSTSTSLRTAGDVNVAGDITFDSNSVIGGDLYANSGVITVQKSLVVRGKIYGNSSVSVANTLFMQDAGGGTATTPNMRIGKALVAEKKFVVQNGNSQNLIVGTAADPNGIAWLNAGVSMQGGANSVIYGSLYVQGSKSDDYLRKLRVTKNLQIDGTDGANVHNAEMNEVSVEGQTHLTGAMFSGAGVNLGFTGGTKTALENGISGMNMTTYSFAGDLYSQRTNQGPGNGTVNVKGMLSLAGTQTPAWNGRWNLTGLTRDWEYEDKTGACTKIAAHVVGGNAPTCKLSNPPDAWRLVRPTPPTMASVGYTEAQLDLSVASPQNSASDFNEGNFVPSNFLTTSALYNNIVNSATADECNLPSSTTDRPTGAQLSCLYRAERREYLADPKGYTGPLYGGEFLVLNVTSGFANGAAGALDVGVKIMFLLDAFTITGNLWYTNPEGSVQVIMVKRIADEFKVNGTIHGFIQFRQNSVKSGVDQQLTGTPLFRVVGALENAGRVKIQLNSGELAVDKTALAAQTVFEEIAKTFSKDPTKKIIRFGKDPVSGPAVIVDQVLQDGWVQFQQVGQFR